MIKKIVLILVLTSFISLAGISTQGYKDYFYQLDSQNNTLCQFNSRYQKIWCVDVQKGSIGFYTAFNQVLVYSKEMIQAIDVIRQQIKWAINMENVYKLHINYPVIVIFSLDKTIAGYDYFSGFQLWQKFSTSYNNMFETDASLWVLNGRDMHHLDVTSGDVIDQIKLGYLPTKLIGNDVYFFYESAGEVYHHNLYLKKSRVVESNFQILDESSTLVWLGNDESSQLRTLSNRIVSDNVKHDLFKIHSPTKSTFAYIQDDLIYLINDKSSGVYQFTRSSNKDIIIDYGYRLNDKIRVFFNGENELWKLKQQKKSESDLDT